MTETWNDIPGYEGKYQASTHGRVRSCGFYVKHMSGKRFCKPTILTQNKRYDDYLQVKLQGKYYLSHRLIALAFLTNEDGKNEVNHINLIRDDNRVENLEWVTCSENQYHKFKVKRESINRC